VGYSTGILAVQSNSRKSAQRFSARELRKNSAIPETNARLFPASELRENKHLV
jgi:hypothetical protein